MANKTNACPECGNKNVIKESIISVIASLPGSEIKVEFIYCLSCGWITIDDWDIEATE